MVGLKSEIIIDEQKYNQLLENQIKWYSNDFVIFEMFKCLKKENIYRDLSFLLHKSIYGRTIALRYFKARNSNSLKRHLERVGIFERLINVYMSVSLLKEFEDFSYNFKIRTQELKYQEFKEGYLNYMIGYNFFIDFDGKEDFENCYEETKRFKQYLDNNKIPYWIMNSSKKGFHIHIPFEYIEGLNYDPKELPNIFFQVIDEFCAVKDDFKSVDKTVNDYARICKIPYSFTNDGSVCIPMTDEMFENFNDNDYEVDYVLKNIKIFKRGLLTRNHGLDDEQLKINVKKFIENYK